MKNIAKLKNEILSSDSTKRFLLLAKLSGDEISSIGITHEIAHYHFGSRCDFYLKDNLLFSTSASIYLWPEVFKESHPLTHGDWYKILNNSKRTN